MKKLHPINLKICLLLILIHAESLVCNQLDLNRIYFKYLHQYFSLFILQSELIHRFVSFSCYLFFILNDYVYIYVF